MNKASLPKYGALFVAVAATAFLAWQAGEQWDQRQQALAQEQMLQRQIKLLRAFALRHPDYEDEAQKQEDELEKLRLRKQQMEDRNFLLQQLQELAAGENLALVAVGSGENNRKEQSKEVLSVQLEAEGDFYSVLRWLRRLERQGMSVKGLQLQSKSKSELVHLKCGVEI